MKLNYRDRILLTAVIVILVWVAGVMLFIKPAIERLQDSQAALDDAKATLSDLKDRNKADENLPERIKNAYAEVTKLTDSFYSIQETQMVSQEVDDLLDENKLVNSALTTTDYTVTRLDPYEFQSARPSTEMDTEVQNYIDETGEDVAVVTPENADAEAGANGEAVAAPVSIGIYEVTIPYKGELEEVEKFCDKLQKTAKQKTMLVKSVNYNFSAETDKEGNPVSEEKNGKSTVKVSDTDVEGSMTLTVYVVKKLPKPNV